MKAKIKQTKLNNCLSAADAFALGIVSSGCSFFVSTPVPYVSDIAGCVSGRFLDIPESTYLEQQNQRSALACAIGASVSGKKVVVALDGLMDVVQTLDFALTKKIPCVIIGICDNNLSGEIVRLKSVFEKIVVLCVSSVDEIYETTIHASNISEEYCATVVILCESYMLKLYESFNPKKPVKIVDRDPQKTKGILRTNNVMQISNSTSPANFPEDISDFELLETSKTRILFISSALTGRLCLDVIYRLSGEKVDAGILRLKTLNPLPIEKMKKIFSGKDKLIVCQSNNGVICELLKDKFPQFKFEEINFEVGSNWTVGLKEKLSSVGLDTPIV